MRGRAVAARRAHNPEAAGSSPAPATRKEPLVLLQNTLIPVVQGVLCFKALSLMRHMNDSYI